MLINKGSGIYNKFKGFEVLRADVCDYQPCLEVSLNHKINYIIIRNYNNKSSDIFLGLASVY